MGGLYCIIEAMVDRIAGCAEPVAMALKKHIMDLDTIVAVRHPDMENRHVDYEIVTHVDVP